MISYWAFFERALNEEQCDTLIHHLEGRYEYQDPTIGFGQENIINKDYRECQIAWADPTKEKALVESLWYYAQRANRDHFNLDLQYINQIQLTKYIGSETNPGKYDWHHDINWMEPKTFHRKLSISVILNDGYDGGLFIFGNGLPQLPTNAQTKGTVIVFPSMHLHQVTPVTKGNRYSLVTWVEGPKWR